ncbi:MAG: SRPBCC domain-containing protein [Candidatus Micrarchaeia archaeon]
MGDRENKGIFKTVMYCINQIIQKQHEKKQNWKPSSIYEPLRVMSSIDDKGEVIEAVLEKVLRYTYWSSMSGLEDKKENYVTVSCIITNQKDNVKLTIKQDNIKTKESKEHAEKSWSTVGEKFKEIAEKI